jgi:hypothetical protein
VSSNILTLIPIEPEYVPAEMSIHNAKEILGSYFPFASAIEIEVTKDVRFIDQGSNWERVICSQCGSSLEPMLWQEMMDVASQSNFADLNVVMPCCDSVLSLNDLQYFSTAGFARFSLEIHNPGEDIQDNQLHKLEVILGSRLKKIWGHY